MNNQNGYVVWLVGVCLVRQKCVIVGLKAVQVFLRGDVQNAKGRSGVVGRSHVHRTNDRSIGQLDVFAVLQLAEQWTGGHTSVQAFLEAERTGSSLDFLCDFGLSV